MRRFDPLSSVTDPMRAALRDAARGDLALKAGVYAGPEHEHRPQTVYALAARGWLRLHAGRDGRAHVYRLTQTGAAQASELARRAAVRAALLAERARAPSPCPPPPFD